MTEERPARIYLLPGRAAPFTVVIRRKPSKCFHVMRWNTETDTVEHGSWFRGKLYPLRCDVSFDGEWMVYLALGAGGNTWNGICCLPWLKTLAEGENLGTWRGGGYWDRPERLMLNDWQSSKGLAGLPFRTQAYRADYGEDEGVLYPRLERDGWQRAGPFGQDRVLRTKKYMVAHDNDAGWKWRPSPEHPTLRMFYRGYLQHGHSFEFRLDEYPLLLDQGVDWATWDSLGQLLVAQSGGIRKYRLADFVTGVPAVTVCFADLAPPPKPQRAGDPT